MATVQSSDSKRQPAKPTSNKPQAKTDGKATVTVVKNGNERTFPRSIWDNLPADKEGYQEVVPTPSNPKQDQIDADNKAKADQEAKDQADAELKAKEEADAKEKADLEAKELADKEAADKKEADDKAAADLAGKYQQPTQSPTYDEAVKAYTDLFKEAPGQDLTIEEILGKITAKKQGGK